MTISQWAEATAKEMERFEDSFIPEPNTGCWLWIGTRRGKGYGAFRTKGRQVAAHRFAYESHIGPFPAGAVTDHRCRVRCCVNPWHLEPVTNTENVLRGIGPTAANAKKTHCPQGHEYTEENTTRKRLGRHCRACNRAYKRRIKLLRLPLLARAACPRCGRLLRKGMGSRIQAHHLPLERTWCRSITARAILRAAAIRAAVQSQERP